MTSRSPVTANLLACIFLGITWTWALQNSKADEPPPAAPNPSTTAAAPSKSLGERDQLTGDWGGWRKQMSEDGFDIRLEYTGECLADVSGGAKRAAMWEGLLKTILDFDTEKMGGWKGGKFHITSFWLDGTEANRTGDITGLTGSRFMDPTNIAGYDTYRLYELWFEQSFLDNKLSIRVGQLALDEEFATYASDDLFLSGPHGWPTFLSNAVPNNGPAFPITATGLRLNLKLTDQIEFQTAVTDGDVQPQAPQNRHGTRFGFFDGDGVLTMYELAYKLNQEKGATSLPGTYTLGGWYHTGTFNDPHRDSHGLSLEDDGTLSGSASNGIPDSHRGNGCFYLGFEQMLYREKPDADRGLTLTGRIAPWLPDDRNPIDFSAVTSLIYKGLIPSRPNDSLGAGIAYVHTSGSYRADQRDANRIAAAGGTPNLLTPGPIPDYEMDLEITYQISLAPWWKLQPDFQYIFHPAGSSALKDAVVVGLRTQISF